MNAKIKIEIVAPVHNRREITLLCLRSLARAKQESIEIHTIIVDDGSTDGTGEAIRNEFPNVEVIEADGSLWFTEGTNVGVRAALKHHPKYVLMINDDQIFDADAIQIMVAAAEKYPRSVIGSLLLLWDTPHKLFQVAPVWNTWAGDWQHWEQQTVWTIPKNPWEVDLIVGNCVLVSTEALQQVGLMNSKRYPNFGDAEFTPRLKRNGWRLLIEPRARVFCQPNAVPKQVNSMTRREKFDALIVNLGHPQNLRRRFYANWDGAPTRFKGLLGFFIFFIRIAERKTAGKTPPRRENEIHNSAYFADTMIKD